MRLVTKPRLFHPFDCDATSSFSWNRGHVDAVPTMTLPLRSACLQLYSSQGLRPEHLNPSPWPHRTRLATAALTSTHQPQTVWWTAPCVTGRKSKDHDTNKGSILNTSGRLCHLQPRRKALLPQDPRRRRPDPVTEKRQEHTASSRLVYCACLSTTTSSPSSIVGRTQRAASSD